MPKLTESVVKHAKPQPGATIFLRDGELKGFGLTVAPGGAKSYFIEYRPTHSRQSKRLKIGAHPTLTATEARAVAKDHLAKISQGSDPAAAKKAVKAETTVSGLMDRFLIEHVAKHNKPSTASRERKVINLHIRPKLGTLRLSQLTGGRVKTWHKGLPNTTGNRALSHLSKACAFAMQYEWLTTNPCTGITKNKEKPKERFFSDAELERIGIALNNLEASKGVLSTLTLGIRLLALTGLRPGEVRTARWEHFDAIRGTLLLPDSKTGRRVAALNPQALSLLRDADRIGPFIVASSDPETCYSETRFPELVKRILLRAGIKDASAHTFRHTMATYMAQNGASTPQIAAAGGWKTLAILQVYIDLHSVGTLNPLQAGERIAIALPHS